MFGTVILPFLIYWLLLFVACYIVMEYGQFYLYDEPAPQTALKTVIGSFVLAGVLTWTRSSFDRMFTNDILWTILQGIVWFVVFVLIFRFHPWHALGLGLAAMILITGLASMAVESVSHATSQTAPVPSAASTSPFASRCRSARAQTRRRRRPKSRRRSKDR